MASCHVKEVIIIKIKEWIITKLSQFLSIDNTQKQNLLEFERINKKVSDTNKRLDRTFDKLYVETRHLGDSIRDISEDCNIVKNTLRSVVSVGTDVGRDIRRDRSWAVVCIEGNLNVVKFVDLHGQDYHMLLDFLKQFEGSRMCIDAPPSLMFDNCFKLK